MSEVSLERGRLPVAPPSERRSPLYRFLPSRSNPWRRPVMLETITWLYLLWSILPVGLAVLFSFNAGRSRTAWQGFSLRWYFIDPAGSVWNDPTLRDALFQTLKLAVITTVIAVPIGVIFAIGVDRWRGRLPAVFNFQMLVSFVIPEIIVGVALLFVFTQLTTFIPLGTPAQVIGLVTFQLSFPVVIVRARLLSIGSQYEEAAMDLGASPIQAVRRVLLPMLWPAIFASAVLVFADVIDDFVIVRALSAELSSETMSVKIYNGARSTATPALNALATIMLVISIVAVAIGFFVYRRMTRDDNLGGGAALDQFAAQL
ncbi:MAG: ABC transporter permease [Candidatus Dormiibacterota bacterium]